MYRSRNHSMNEIEKTFDKQEKHNSLILNHSLSSFKSTISQDSENDTI